MLNDEAFPRALLKLRHEDHKTIILQRVPARWGVRPSHARNGVQVVVVAAVSLVFGLERRGGAGGVSIHFMFDITRLAVNNTIDLALHHLLLQEAAVPGRGSLAAGDVRSSPGANTLLPDWRGRALALSTAPPAGCRRLVDARRDGGRHGGEHGDVRLLRVPGRRPRRTVAFRLKHKSLSILEINFFLGLF